ncbi:hypothetical protein P171DRAFT_430590 [Karstenula rhodostoma CBS 690.94]|uniref:Uncharacterized protein n=1 Tax=Karstenula rhodostoma CBS 690.94 TaxID=1392251 RepID=A0A9P4UDK4_9PLEO|nr:hypothetical protein P171DRAFT_430590 [Karstenula rhodostoma CBS 690.94]
MLGFDTVLGQDRKRRVTPPSIGNAYVVVSPDSLVWFRYDWNIYSDKHTHKPSCTLVFQVCM